MQSQPVFVDIHMNNGHRLGTQTFKGIMNGRFNGDMQLAFEQYLGDFKDYGTAYRTYRYMIVNGNMLQLHGVLNPFPAGPALAALVTQPGQQNANAQTQASGNQTPYASQLNQSVAISLGPVDPSAVQNTRCPPASTAQRSVSLPRQLNPRASEFKLGSAANSLAASARPLALPTASSAPARPPCLPVTQQPQFAPSSAHPGFFAPDTTRAATGPPMLTTPYLSPTHSHGQAVPQQAQLTPFNARQGNYNPDTLSRSAGAAVWAPTLITPYSPILSSPVPAIPQQPQLAPCNHHRGGLTLNTRLGLFDGDGGQAAEAPVSPSALANNYFTASRESWMASPSPLDLAVVSPSETNNQHLSSRQWGRRTSEHSSDASSHSSSDQDQSSCPWCLHHGYRCLHRRNSVSNINRSSYHTAKISFSKANTTKITSHGPQNGEADTGVAPSPSPPQFQSRYDTDNIEERRLRQNLRPSTAIRGKMPPWDPLSEYLSGQHEAFYSNLYKRWRRSAPPELGISGFYDHLQSLPEGLRYYHDVFGLRNPEGPVTTPPPWSSRLPSDTVSHHTKSPTVGNGTNRSREMAQFDTSAPRTLTRNGPDTSSRNDIPLPTSPHPQLHHGEEGSEHGGSSCSDPKSAIEVQLEARSSVEEEEEDRGLQQRLNGFALFFSNTIEEVRRTIREMEEATG